LLLLRDVRLAIVTAWRAHAAARAPGAHPGPGRATYSCPRERLPRAEPQSGGSPDPIPNSAVKPRLAESTAAPGRGRTGRSARRGRFPIVPRARPCAGADAPANGADAVFGTPRGAFCFLGPSGPPGAARATPSPPAPVRGAFLFSGRFAGWAARRRGAGPPGRPVPREGPSRNALE